MKSYYYLLTLFLLFSMYACRQKSANARPPVSQKSGEILQPVPGIKQKVEAYAEFPLTTDLSKLNDEEKKIIPLLIRAVDIMNGLFWYQAYGDKAELLSKIKDPYAKRYVHMNYGPWDRLDDFKPFLQGVGEKPLGANFYPEDMTKDEFEKTELSGKTGLYTFLRRDAGGKLHLVPYHQQFKAQLADAAGFLLEAAELTSDEAFKKYLELRAKALLTDQYFESDMAWMDMKDNHLDVVIGPIETYEDRLFGYKASYEGYVLVKDMEWSKRLAHYTTFLPELQKGIPVPPEYKAEKPASKSDLNAYDVIYYAGDCNAGGKTIAINLPNDEKVQEAKGSRRLQLKNAMRAKFDKILIPIAQELITPEQRQYITFDAFFANTMFHEVAHGLGIRNTINGKGTVRKALKEHASALEEGKADILGLYMVNELHRKGELGGDMKEYMTTFMASIFRSIRFGAGSAHGRANMIRFNFFKEKGAFTRNGDGTYTVNYDKMYQAMKDLTRLILTLQGDGDYDAVSGLVNRMGKVDEVLQKDLDRLAEKNIPVDIVFEQGIDVLGL